ncbi:MAG TPA: FAD-binding protein [Sediminispirochaeta sp.]|nr:FAD-binding protein [Sediminispirochaeta sp.]
MTYQRVSAAILQELRKICGEENVFVDPEKMEAYSHDETPAQDYGHMPEVVTTPTTTSSVAEILKLANREMIPVTPRGAGSGLSGGAIPVYGGIVLSVEKMNRIIEVDYDNMMLVVEPGVVTNDINDLVGERGLFFAGYPMSLETCFVGGNIAENAGGGKAVKYGVTGQYITGMELVTPTGEVIELGGKIIKDVSGYDLKKLIIGSEGTLGIVTKSTIRLTPKPKEKTVLLVLFADIEGAISMVPKIMTGAGIIPTSIEFMDQLSVHTSCKYLNEQLPYQDAGSMLLIEVDGSTRERVDEDAEVIGEMCFDGGALEVYVADNYTTQERVWSVRRNIAEAFKVYSPEQSLEDIVVPVNAIVELMRRVNEISEKYKIQMPSYGHAGDGNLHTTLVKPPEWSHEEWRKIEEQILRELYREVRRLGGKLSGEHGIGSKRKTFFQDFINESELMLIKKIKSAFDPKGIMNPGKIVD